MTATQTAAKQTAANNPVLARMTLKEATDLQAVLRNHECAFAEIRRAGKFWFVAADDGNDTLRIFTSAKHFDKWLVGEASADAISADTAQAWGIAQ